jgi:hypothetical protein
MKVGRAITLAAICLVASACFHQVVQTGRTPGTTVVHKPWVSTWIFGLVAATPIDVSKECPNGIATVETQESFINGLVSIVTAIIWMPRDVTITCAAGRASLGGLREINVASTASPAERQAAFNAAIELSDRIGQPVIVSY